MVLLYLVVLDLPQVGSTVVRDVFVCFLFVFLLYQQMANKYDAFVCVIIISTMIDHFA